MRTAELIPTAQNDVPGRMLLRQLSDQAFSRASGTPLRHGNSVQLLKDATANYPAWLEAIHAARRTVHLEMYIFAEDPEGERFAEALLEKARQGVQVRVLQDWMGGFGRTSRGFWARLRQGGVEVRTYNPFRFDRPLGWVSRNHRKVLSLDREVAFITGLCIAQEWVGDPARGIPPWRDTGVALRGPAVADVEDAFAEAWATAGAPLPAGPPDGQALSPAGDMAVRVVATVPNTAGLFRVDQLVAALAQKTLWLTDAYFTATAPYVQALRAAAEDGVDVRLLVPGSSDLPLIQPLSRSGYRPLLEAGVRVFEWNGSMIHAKTAVADSRWARVGSTNLNLASWVGNRELDVIVEDGRFAQEMEAMYLADLQQATEVVLDLRKRLHAPSAPHPPRDRRAGLTGGSSGRVVAGAARLGDTVTAAITNRRVLEPMETRVTLAAAALLLLIAVLAVLYPRALAYPLAAIAAWFSVALVSRGISLRLERGRRESAPPPRLGAPAGDAREE